MTVKAAPEAVAGEPMQVVVADHVPLVDDPYAAGIRHAVAEKDVVLDHGVVAVPHRERAARFQEQVSAEGVAAGLVGDDLQFAVAAIEHVVLDDSQRIGHREVAGADPQRLAAVGSQYRPRAEVVVVDAVVVSLVFLAVQPHGHRDPEIALALDVVVIEPVVAPEHQHPEINLMPLWVIEPVDYGLGHPRVIGGLALRPAKGNHGAGWRVAVPEHQSGHDQVAAGKPQVGLAADHDLPLRLRRQRNRPFRLPVAGKENLEIAPHPVGEHDHVTGLGALHGITVLLLIRYQRLDRSSSVGSTQQRQEGSNHRQPPRPHDTAYQNACHGSACSRYPCLKSVEAGTAKPSHGWRLVRQG